MELGNSRHIFGVGRTRNAPWHVGNTSGPGRLGIFCQAFLVPDIILWDPMSYFPHRVVFCPSCDEEEVKEDLHPIRWMDGSKTHEQPRLLMVSATMFFWLVEYIFARTSIKL